VTFHIISVGWQCASWMEQTLRSVAVQSVDDWQAWVTYDPSDDDGADVLRAWGRSYADDPRWHIRINEDRRYAVRNQYEALAAAQPADDDIIVFLDLDGDRLAHPDVLAHLLGHYADGTLLTYGSYKAVPDPGTSPPAVPFPRKVIANSTYRKQMLTGICCFNHLRTMKGRVFNAIPPDHFRFAAGPRRGEWYTIGTDYVFMAPALELAGGRHKFITETLLLYNHDNPHADYLTQPVESFSCVQDTLHRPPLRGLP
jgi:glycosyltransferase involved in cell wall biosynthesis